MATCTTSFPSWTGFEALLSAAQVFESSPTFTAIQNSLDSLQSHVLQNPVSTSGTSNSATLFYADGVVAYAQGFSFGTAGAVITHIQITDGQSSIVLEGFISAQNPAGGTFNSYSYSGFGYSEGGRGQIYIDGRPVTLNEWSSTVPTSLGTVTLHSTGTATLSDSTAGATYNTISMTDSAGHKAEITGLNYTTSQAAGSTTNYVQLLHDVLSGSDYATGSAGNEELRTFTGNDTLNGSGGADTLAGGAGNDTYVVTDVREVINEFPNEGTDQIQASVSFTLPASVENLSLLDVDPNSTLLILDPINGTGNELDNIVTGNSRNNVISGNGGNDTLTGASGNDTLEGGAGSDTAVFSSFRIFYTLNAIAGGWTLSGPDQTDTLTAIEFAQFADQTISLGNYAPTGAVTISGAAAQNQTLSASNTLADLNGLGAVTYQWKANGNPIGGATGSSLTLTQVLVGKTISVTASYTDQHGNAESMTSDATTAVANVNDPPTVAAFGNRSAGVNEAVAINLGMLFSDPDGDVLSFAATGLPGGLSIHNGTGQITGTSPGAVGVHHVSVTATDPGNASATLNFDLIIANGNTLTANVVTRGGLALPGVVAHEFISETAAGTLYGFRNLSLDTHAVSGVKTLSTDVVATGSSATGALDLTFHSNAGTGLQSFELTGPVTASNDWTIVTNSSVANRYGISAIHISEPIVANTLIGKLSVTLPATAPGTSIIDLTDATLGDANSPARGLTYNRVELGSLGQLNATLPDSNLAISLEHGTSDLIVAGRKPITAADALDALKLSVGLASSQGSSWKELIAADMNHDGRVTAADALEILKTSVGINTIQPAWVFVPNDASVNPNLGAMTRTSVSYHDEFNLASLTAPTSASITGILVGDVNNSWSPPTIEAMATSATIPPVIVPTTTTTTTTTTTATTPPVTITPTEPAPTSATITGILVEDVNNSWVIPA